LEGIRGSRFCSGRIKKTRRALKDAEKRNPRTQPSMYGCATRAGSRRLAPAFLLGWKLSEKIRYVTLVVNIWIGGLVEAVRAAAELPHSKLVVKGVDNRDVGIHFDGTPIEDGGTVAPLADRS